MSRTADEARILQRRKTVAVNLLNGMSVTEIAEAMDLNKSTISRDAKALRQEWREDRGKDTALLIEMENKRLDIALLGIYKKVKEGDLFAIDRLIKIMDRRAKLLGLDKPTKINAAVTDMTDEELMAYLESGDPKAGEDNDE